MNRPSFHERVWDLQQRKAGAEVLNARINVENWFRKLSLNSTYGKSSDRFPLTSVDGFRKIYNRFAECKNERLRLQREFRPF